MDDALLRVNRNFENTKKTAPNGEDYWMGRDLQIALGYQNWQNFDNVIRKAIVACRESGANPQYHFIETNKEIEAGKGAKGERGDWYLTRYACYLIAMNGDPAKYEIAIAQTYFAVQTRRQEIADAETPADPDAARIALRERVLRNNHTLAGVAKDAGVMRYQLFNNEGYRGLYGMGIKEIKRRKGIPEKETILDYSGRAELAAHDFRITQTEEKLKRENIKGEQRAMEAHRHVGQEVRDAIKRVRGVLPEDMPKEEHIKKLVSAKKKAAKALRKGPKLIEG
jgi:DNA-damage-inducible protein D